MFPGFLWRNPCVLMPCLASAAFAAHPPDSCGVLNTVGNLLGGAPCQFDGCLLFDECHKAKNLGAHPPTKVGLAVAEIQELLPNARVIYCSA